MTSLLSVKVIESKGPGLLLGITKNLFSPTSIGNKKVAMRYGFQAGDGQSTTRIRMNWLLSDTGKKALSTLVTLIKKNYTGYVERHSIENAIIHFLQFNLFNEGYFSDDFLKHVTSGTVFDSRTISDPILFSKQLLAGILKQIETSNQQLIYLVPLKFMNFSDLQFANFGMRFLRQDSTNIAELIKKYPYLKDFDWKSGRYRGSSLFEESEPNIPGWLIVEFDGDDASGHTLLAHKIKQLFAIVFSIYVETDYGHIHMALKEDEIYYHCPRENGFSSRYYTGIKFPNSGINALDDATLQRVSDAYQRIATLPTEMQNRFSIAANYFANSLQAKNIEQFICLFIALDAIYGKRDSTRKSVVAGIERVDGKIQQNRADLLYALRCEILHGSCLLINDWKQYDMYFNAYGTDPLQDLIKITAKAVREIIT